MSNYTTKKDGAGYVIECLKQTKKIIVSQTELFFNGCKQLKNHEDEIDVHKMKYRRFEAASSERVAMMFFMLIIALPLLWVTDFASLREFFLFLGSRVGDFFGSIIGAIGFVLFGLLELGIGAYVIYTRTRDVEGKATKGQIWLGRILMVVMVLLPLLLIFAGYELDPDKTFSKLVKTIVLMLLSAAIHIFIFACIQLLWDAIVYFLVYKIESLRLRLSNPVDKVIRLRSLLKDSYSDYDDHLNEYDKVSVEIKNTFDPKLGKREQLLRLKLSDSDPDNDFDVSDIINATKPNFENHQNGTATVVTNERSKAGFKYYTTTSSTL
jgi:hypothetical protein